MNQLNENGERHGYWEFYRENGNLDSKGNFEYGQEHGYWEFYRENGTLELTEEYKTREREFYLNELNELLK